MWLTHFEVQNFQLIEHQSMSFFYTFYIGMGIELRIEERTLRICDLSLYDYEVTK